MSSIGHDVAEAARLLRAGELVAIPTETVYGLAALASSEAAVARVFEAKGRPRFDPLILHLASVEGLDEVAAEVPAIARRLAEAFWPGPLTLVLPKRACVPDIVTAGAPTVALRVPRHPLALALLEAVGAPLAAPSANPFGYISPTTPQHVADQLGEAVALILDGGPCEVGVESTIVHAREDGLIVLRKGGLALEALEAVAGPVKVETHSSSNPAAPGMLASHYAPSAPLRLGELHELLREQAGDAVGVIAWSEPAPGVPLERQVILSPTGSDAEAARNLFAGMRRLDALGLDIICAEPAPERGLGRAINDRLRRAAATEGEGSAL